MANKGKVLVGVLAMGAAFGGVIYAVSRPVQAAAPILGDVNGDGIVDVVDLMLATRIAQGLTDPLTGNAYPVDWASRADINGDGLVDNTDLLAIEDIILGIA